MLELKTISRNAKEKAKEGYIPAVFYGSHAKSTPVFVEAIAFNKVFAQAGESSSISLVTEGGKEIAMIQDVQRHPVKNNTIHVDFLVLEKGQKVHVKIPIVFSGESEAVKAGGVLVKVMYELSVEGDPSKLPHEVTADLSLLATQGSVITAKDIALPAGVTLYHVNAEDIVASISGQHEEQESTGTVDLSSIEVAKKGKKEEETENA
jgi:large subunit ribosomal protein L25